MVGVIRDGMITHLHTSRSGFGGNMCAKCAGTRLCYLEMSKGQLKITIVNTHLMDPRHVGELAVQRLRWCRRLRLCGGLRAAYVRVFDAAECLRTIWCTRSTDNGSAQAASRIKDAYRVFVVTTRGITRHSDI